MRVSVVTTAVLLALAAPVGAAADDDCPPAFVGAKVTVAPVRGGVAIAFRNPHAAHVREMRAQLREVALLLEQHSTQVQSVGDDEELDFPPVDISVKDIGAGARVTVRAARVRDVPVLREIAAGFAEFWLTSPCALAPYAVRT